MIGADGMIAFDAPLVTDYLTARLGSPVQVDELTKLGRGASRETWSVTYRTSDRSPAIGIMLRTDPPSGSTDPTPLDQEYFIYERLGHADVPVARALWWEEDRSWIGRPFYVRERIDGHWSVPHFSDPDPRHDAVRIATAKQHIELLARVHAVDWQRLGIGERLPVPPDPEHAAHTCIRTVEQRYAQVGAEAIPVFHEACEWLRDTAPPSSELCLCKGTNGYGEEIFRDGVEVALSDWEEVSIGDPAADFAFMQRFLEPLQRDGQLIWGLQPALDYYESLTGLRIAAETVGYYHMIRALNMLVMCHNAAALSQAHPDTYLRQVWTGVEPTHIAKRLLAAGMGMVAPPRPDRFQQLVASIDMT